MPIRIYAKLFFLGDRNSYRLQHADERENAQEGVPASQRKAQIKRLLLLGHDHGTKSDEGDVSNHNADGKRPVVGGEVDRRGRDEVSLNGKSKKVRGRHQVLGQVVDESGHLDSDCIS